MKVFFYTLGCKVNQYETKVMKDSFLKYDFEIGEEDGQNDVYVINTCSVTSESDRKSRQMIRKARKQNKDAVIAVCGCYPQGNAKSAAGLDEADIVIGTKNKAMLPEMILDFIENKSKIVDVGKIDRETGFENMTITDYDSKKRATIKIEDGCNSFCSYCIIPYVRGRVRSKPMPEIISEVRELVGNGYYEIVLSGIHLDFYGKDLNCTLTDLIEKLGEIKDLKRIRLSSLDPTYITEETVLRLSKIKSLCPHFHLSLQSGSDSVLKRMNRKYATAEYKAAVDLLRKYIPGVMITTDIITGFPGESEKEFDETLSFVEQVRFLKVHVFPYSKREGTAAANMTNQIPKNIKHKRAKALQDKANKIGGEILNEQIGKSFEVLIEQTTGDGIYEGHSKSYLPIQTKSNKDITGKLVNVKVTGCENGVLISVCEND